LSRSVITLTTDFGSADYFVGVMKGVILNINPEVHLVDLSHEVASFNVLDGALTIGLNYAFFPEGAIHVVVVDPGVGSARRPIIARTAHHTFVAPDNGVLSVVFEREAILDVRHITADRYFLHPVSCTFHGRDVFARVAGWLSRGTPAENFGSVINDYVRYTIPRPRRLNHQQSEASVIKVDKFGNLMTNLRREDLPERISPERASFKIIIKGREIARLAASFAEGSPLEPFSYIGSAGFLEIALNEGSAAQLLSAGPGTEVTLHINDRNQP
jgi:S-adenosyl-L-methionine hydrolase (adenosine-forming)